MHSERGQQIVMLSPRSRAAPDMALHAPTRREPRAMSLPPYAVEMAVLRRFRDLHVFHAGAALFEEDLADGWQGTGLRSRDLDTGLSRLEAQHCVEIDRNGDGGRTLVKLMAEGASRISELPAARWFDELLGSVNLFLAARRSRSPRVTDLRRRLHHFSS